MLQKYTVMSRHSWPQVSLLLAARGGGALMSGRIAALQQGLRRRPPAGCGLSALGCNAPRSAGLGQIDHGHLEKAPPAVGMLIVKIGGPAYRIGMGGGAASSVPSGSNAAELDFNAVQARRRACCFFLQYRT